MFAYPDHKDYIAIGNLAIAPKSWVSLAVPKEGLLGQCKLANEMDLKQRFATQSEVPTDNHVHALEPPEPLLPHLTKCELKTAFT